MKFCKNCGAILRENDVFCGECGQKVTSSPQAANPIPQTPVTPVTPVTPETPVTPVAPQQSYAPGQTVTPQQSYTQGQTVTPVVQNPAGNPKKKGNAWLIVLIVLLSVAVVAVAGFFAYQYFVANQEVKSVSGTGLEGDTPEVDTDFTPTISMSEIDDIISIYAPDSDISVCVYDMENDLLYTTNSAYRAKSASALVNIPILYTVSEELDDGNYSWYSQVPYYHRFGGRGNLTADQDGMEFDLDYMVEQMLNYSDNNVTNSLMDYLGRSYIEFTCDYNGYDSVVLERYLGDGASSKDNYISAVDTTNMMAELYQSYGMIDGAYLRSNFHIYDDARSDGIGRGLPNGVTFLNHNAYTSKIYNEVAIVESDDTSYVITVMCIGDNPDDMKDAVAEISEYVFEELDR